MNDELVYLEEYDRYVTRDGRVFRNRKGHNEIVECKLYLCNGYYRVRISNHKHKLVHRMVAEAFLPNPYNKPEVDHIDRNSQNNNVENLRWVTRSENINNRVFKNSIVYKLYGKKYKELSNGEKCEYNRYINKKGDSLNCESPQLISIINRLDYAPFRD